MRILLARRDAAGVSVEQAILAFGLDPAHLAEAKLDPHLRLYRIPYRAGPVLELRSAARRRTAIAGQSRLAVLSRTGQPRRTTPMHLRRDALAAASRWISVVERHARATPG
jgi:allantoate deiminase